MNKHSGARAAQFRHRPIAIAAHMALAATAWSLVAPAAAQVPSLPEVKVQAAQEEEGYRVNRITSATKTDTAIVDTPQAITVITDKLIRDQAMQGMADVTRYVPGIGMANGEGNRDSPVFRGSNSASGDFYIDGVRDDVEYYRDLYNVERVEALTGPAGMIFGRGGSGGVINRVTKWADGRTIREAALTLGSYDNKRLTFDIGQAVSDTVAVRLTGLLEDSGGYQRNAELKRAGLNPTVSIRPGKDTLVVLGYEHFEDERTTDRGIPSFAGKPLNLPVDAFFGDANPDKRPTKLISNAFTALVEHDFGNGLHLSNRTRYTDYNKFYQNYNAGAFNAATQQVPISAYNNHQWRSNFFNQTDLTFDTVLGGLKQKFLVGMELGTQDTDYLRQTGVFANGATSINVPLANSAGPLLTNYVLGGSTADRNGRSKAKIAGFYVQDQVELSPQWQLIAGLRYDRFDLDYHNNVTTGPLAPTAASPANLNSSDGIVSPRLGVVFKPVPTLSLYANYSMASFPRGGDQLSSLSSVNQALKPEKFINYEVGGKWEINPGLLATVAVYRLDRKNVAVTNPATGIADQLVDGARTNGVEIGIGGKVTNAWSINGGYAYQDAKLTATAGATALAGAVVQNVPKNTLALWNRYDFNPTIGAGLGVIHRDASYTSTSNLVTMPAYTRLDAAVFYTISRTTQLQLNVENLTNKKYYAFANGDTNITPGSPRAARVTLRASF